MFIFKWLQRHPTGIRFDLAISTPPIQFRYKEKVIAAYASMILQFGGGVILPLFNIRFCLGFCNLQFLPFRFHIPSLILF